MMAGERFQVLPVAGGGFAIYDRQRASYPIALATGRVLPARFDDRDAAQAVAAELNARSS